MKDKNWKSVKQQASLAKQYKAALEAMMVGQQFDHGGHLMKRIYPPHSAIISAKILLDSQKQYQE